MLSRVKRVVAAVSVSALMFGAMAVPAFAFVHENVPSDECSGNDRAGANETAGSNLFTKNEAQGGENLPLADNSRSPVPDACQ